MVKVEKNFLPIMFFDKLKFILASESFLWHFEPQTIYSQYAKQDNNFMFTHILFSSKDIEPDKKQKHSGWFKEFEPIIYYLSEKIKIKRILRMKLNLYTNQNKRVMYGTHCDRHDDKGKPFKDVNTAILNFTTCNGGTKIGNKIYKSKANELLIFNNTIEHAGIVQTDTQTRVILNINWR